jgi:hypothetical protein
MWSWVLGTIGVTALFHIGKGRWWGWAIAFTNECLWMTYGISTKQYGFCFAALCYGTVNFTSGHNWRKKHEAKRDRPIH